MAQAKYNHRSEPPTPIVSSSLESATEQPDREAPSNQALPFSLPDPVSAHISMKSLPEQERAIQNIVAHSTHNFLQEQGQTIDRIHHIQSYPSTQFEIAQEEEEVKAESSCKRNQRVSAGSKVNFIFLSEPEQVERYKNIRQEYFAVKKQLECKEKQFYQTSYAHLSSLTRAKARKNMSKPNSLLLEARDKLENEGSWELPDCESVLDNLAELLASGAIKSDSLELALLCNIVRKVKMGLSSKEALSLQTKSNSFLKQSTRGEIVSFARGEDVSGLKLEKPQPIYPASRADLTQRDLKRGNTEIGSGEASVYLRAQISGSKVEISQHVIIQSENLPMKRESKTGTLFPFL